MVKLKHKTFISGLKEGYWFTGRFCLIKLLTSHFDECSQYCHQHDFALLDNWMLLALARGCARLMVVWVVEIHCTPENRSSCSECKCCIALRIKNK